MTFIALLSHTINLSGSVCKRIHSHSSSQLNLIDWIYNFEWFIWSSTHLKAASTRICFLVRLLHSRLILQLFSRILRCLHSIRCISVIYQPRENYNQQTSKIIPSNVICFDYLLLSLIFFPRICFNRTKLIIIFHGHSRNILLPHVHLALMPEHMTNGPSFGTSQPKFAALSNWSSGLAIQNMLNQNITNTTIIAANAEYCQNKRQIYACCENNVIGILFMYETGKKCASVDVVCLLIVRGQAIGTKTKTTTDSAQVNDLNRTCVLSARMV